MGRNRRDYRNSRRDRNRRERTAILLSSAFVLTALTLSGIYMRNQSRNALDDGYTMDFTKIENTAPEKSVEIAKNQKDSGVDGHSDAEREKASGNGGKATSTANQGKGTDAGKQASHTVNSTNVEHSFGKEMADDLDYMPLLEELPLEEEVMGENIPLEESAENAPIVEAEAAQEVFGHGIVESAGLIRPVEGEIMIPFSMSGSVYFPTLDQYKRNPAVIYQAPETTVVIACADSKVLDIYEDAEIGRAVKMDLGDGYEVVYGQLQEIYVTEGSEVVTGQAVGNIAAPTKYYSVEGSNLYFCLKKDGVAINPEELYR